MILRIFSLILEPADPLQFSLPEFRTSIARQLTEQPPRDYDGSPAGRIIYRYPAIHCKDVKGELVLIGICQGAWFLHGIAEGKKEIVTGNDRCTIVSRDMEIRDEEFGIDGGMHTYEFRTPWLALNQQNARKFYDLKGKPARDAFMHKILKENLKSLAKSLDYSHPESITCTAHVRFKRERIDRENIMVFLGKFETNLRIPNYLAIGQSVSQGYGTIRKVTEGDGLHQDETPE
jgi:hypothetical protein